MQTNITSNYINKVAAAALFTMPFACSAGTAGHPQLQEFSSTGSSFYTVQEPKSDIAIFAEKLATIQENYGLEKQQLARLLAIARPTLDSWLDKKIERIRPSNQDRLEQLERLLSSNISPKLKDNFGHLLKRKLDDDSAVLFTIFSENRINEKKAQLALKAANLRLSGLMRAKRLDKLLGEDRPAFI